MGKRNAAPKIPKFAVCDAETDPFDGSTIPAPFVWGFFDGEEYIRVDTPAELADILRDYDGICYAHNGGKFDFHFLLDYIEPYEEVMIINGRISKMRIGMCELRDSYNILPVPLSAYKKDDFDYNLMKKQHRDKPKNQKLIREYLQNDCKYLHELITRFFTEYGLNLTVAGTAMKVWKTMSPVDVAVTQRDFYETFSPYYYGGRVQCFEKGVIDADFSVIDINSAYPFAMLSKHPYSANYASYDHWHPQADFVTLWGVSKGALPFRTATGLSFPDDDERRLYTVTRWEYDAATETKTLSEVEVIQTFVFCGHMEFSEYIEYFYAKRMEAGERGDDAGKLIFKLLLTNLYGKFASNPETYKNYMPFPMEHAGSMEVSGWSFGGELGPWALGECPLSEDKQRYYNVATGASITGFVRAMLWRAMCASDRVLYCDTDSIAVCGDVRLDMGNKLGQWKHEGQFNRAGIAGKKLYVFQAVKGQTDDKGKAIKNKTASKGVRLTEEQLWQVAGGDLVEYHPQAPTFSVRGEPRFTPRNVRMT